MSLLVSAGIAQCMKFYSIENNQVSTDFDPDKDFFVGPKVKATLTIPDGEKLQVRDLVVLGKFSILPPDTSNTSATTFRHFVARDCFVAGSFCMNKVDFQCRNQFIAKNVQTFKKELEEII